VRALVIIAPILCILAIAYRYYSLFIAKHVMALDDSRITPAHIKNDGHNFFPTTRWVLFGHHFAAIAGAGPLVGPVFAAQFGYAPGLIWLVGGVCIAGAVQDYIWLWASTRRGGRSLADIARNEVSLIDLYYSPFRNVCSKKIEGFVQGPLGLFSFQNVKKGS